MNNSVLLIVEDDPQIRDTLCEAFAVEGYVTWSAEHGQAALKRLEVGEASGEFPQAIILDLQMPVMDGRTFLNHVEGRAAFRDIPVIIYSSDPDPAPRGYRKIRKPSDLHLLINVIGEAVAERNR